MNTSKQEPLGVQIREEQAADIEAISDVTIAAFKTLAISNHTEQYIINALRVAGVLTVSLVTEIDGQVIGHVAFSPITISDGTEDWYGLGPISVQPEYHLQGIGKALVEQGLAMLKEKGGQGCALVGDPAYYQRFGFKSLPDLMLPGVPAEAFMALPLSERHPEGVVTFHDAFLVDGGA